MGLAPVDACLTCSRLVAAAGALVRGPSPLLTPLQCQEAEPLTSCN